MSAIPLPNDAEAIGIKARPFASGGTNGAHYDRGSEKKAGRFPIVGIDEIELGNDPPWLIKGLLPAAGLAVVFGLPKCGKSFLVSDALFAVARGVPWVGRDVLQGAVVYVSSEGTSGLRRRFVAMRRHYGVEGQGIPFAFVPAMPDLGHASGDVDVLIETVRAWLASIGNPPLRALVIDTLARAMNGGDENATKDMGTLVGNAEKIAAHFGCLVLVVHHVGRAAEGRSRGSNALDGAADAMWHVEQGEAQSRVALHSMKDGETEIQWAFRLRPYYFGSEGGAQPGATSAGLSTCTVEILADPAFAQPSATTRLRKSLPASPKMLLEITTAAILEAGEFVKGHINVPPDVRVITRETLKRYARIRGYYEDGRADNSNRALLSKDLKRLATERYVGLTNEHIWLVQERPSQ